MEPQEKILARENRGFDFLTQVVEGAACSVAPFPVIKESANLVVLNLTSEEWLEIASSLHVGAMWAYPDKSHQIFWNFVRSTHCPPIMAEQECYEYPSYASFINYAPTNPYVEPDTIPDGYLLPPFAIVGENGYEDAELEHYDVVVPFGAFELLAGWFDLLGGLVPQITITVNGAGHADIRLLTMPFGGLCVITVDSPPNLIDIIVGIVTGAENIVDLNLDNVSVPPETAREIIFPVDIVGTGLHTIYIDFLPIMDDSFIPLRFGGGFRGVQLCNFVEGVVDMSVQDIRVNGCEIEYFKNGEWVGLVSGSLEECYAPISEVARNDAQDVQIGNLEVGLDFIISEYLAYVDETALVLATMNDTIENLYLEFLVAQGDIINAQNTANGAVTVNNTQNSQISSIVTVNNTQNSRLTALETSQGLQDIVLDNLADRMTDAEIAIDALEGASTLPSWSTVYDFTSSALGWAGNTWVGGEGFTAGSGVDLFISKAAITVFDGRATLILVECSRLAGVGSFEDYTVAFGDLTQSGALRLSHGGITSNWYKVPNKTSPYSPALSIPNVTSQFYLRKMTVYGVGTVNPFV